MSRILVIDDNETLREGIGYAIRKMGHVVSIASGGRAGLQLYKPGETDFVITDLKMDDLDGIAVLKEIRKQDPEALVMVITAFGTIEVAVDAMKAGAYDFIAKPFSTDLLRAKVEKALQTRSLQVKQERLLSENQALRTDLAASYEGGEIIGSSEPMQRVFRHLKKIAASDSTVHVFGESGTGKELVARAIHDMSPRSNGPFIKVNCGALPETLLESELFGHEKGSFTNAIKRKLGRFELAENGSIFLDEIGDISPTVQVKLLRVLQEKEFERVGGEAPIKANVRIISATNKDLQKEVDAGRFREDLFYRLHILPVILPPLRERLDDIPSLTEHFLKKLERRTRHTVKQVAPDVLEIFRRYPWPGNIRELENVLEQALVFAEGQILSSADLPPHIHRKEPSTLSAKIDPSSSISLGDRPLPQILDDIEKALILQAYEKSGGVKAETARLLGIKTPALYYKLEKYGIAS